VNRAIRVPEVRVVNDEGTQLGVMSSDAARDIAGRIGLDLVEISPNARPPVCKIMDYGRYKYELKKKASVARKQQHQVQVKEIKMRPQIDDHDLDFKIRKARGFFIDGDKVKCTVTFRGREIVHRQVGFKLMERVAELLGDISIVESRPQMEGRMLSQVLAPNKAAVDKIKAREENQRLMDERAAAKAEEADSESSDSEEETADAAEEPEATKADSTDAADESPEPSV
jgi:translation initiation factor IF-3